MDNLCHTLAGAAFAAAGLKHRTRFGTATLVVAANLPDVDALVFATDLPSVAFRRGWTHGLLAQALLPVGLAVMMMLVDRLRSPKGLRHNSARHNSALVRSSELKHGSHPDDGAALQRCDFRGLLLLSYIGVLSHVLLDLLNNYGVRLLMPFSNRWFYGDSVFIIDVWLWLALGAGALRAWQEDSTRPARIALAVATAYIAILVVSSHAARTIVLERWRAERGGDPRALMVGPMPVTPFTKRIIVDVGDRYEAGLFTWFPGRVHLDGAVVPKNDRHPAAIAAASDPRVRAVLTWSRFPYYQITRDDEATRVALRDMRFGESVGAVTAKITKTN